MLPLCAEENKRKISPQGECVAQGANRGWSRPHLHAIEINVDAAWDVKTGVVRIGLAAKDFTGPFRAGLRKMLVGDIRLSQAITVKEGLSLARVDLWQHVIFESDSEIVR